MVPYLVFGVSMLVTLGVWRVAADATQNKDQQRLQHSFERAQSLLEERLGGQIALLRATAGLFSSQRDVTRDEFRRYVNQLDLPKNYPGLLGLGYSQVVPPESVGELSERMKQAGWPNFRIYPKTSEPHAIVLLEPETQRNRVAIGYDMHSEPVRRAAMDYARDTGQPGMTGTVHLVQEIMKDSQPGFLIYYPVFAGGDPGNVAERRARLRGFVYCPFRVKDFFGTVFDRTSGLEVEVAVYDPATQPPTLWFTNAPTLPKPSYPTLITNLAHQPIAVRFSPTAEFVATSGQGVVRWIPLAGLAISIVLAGLSMAQSRANRALERQTEELRVQEYRQRLLAQISALLGESQDVDQTLANVAQFAVPSFADWCVVNILDEDGRLRNVATTHINPGKVRWAREIQERYPIDPSDPSGTMAVLRTGKAAIYPEITPEMLTAIARDEEHANLLREVGLASAIVVPMTTRGKALGVITFVWAESGHRYGPEDLQLAEEIGSRAGLALENARLFAENQRELDERRRAEARVRELNENLEQLVRERTTELEASNRELEAFCYSVSHDLRGPLRSVDGFTKAVIDDYGRSLDEEGIGYLNRVRAAARRMDELITALLNLSRYTRAEIHIQPVDLTAIAESIAAEMRSGTKARFEIHEGLSANADPRMVRIILDNLIGNAIKFSGNHSMPVVEVGRSEGAFFVRDNGVGFNPDYAGKLFSPFERLHRQEEFPGSGIGLATVQRIVARHGGRVWAESEPGKGATFWFTLSS